MAREYFADLNSEVANKLDKTGQAADSDKLDGLQASQFLRSDASDSTTGKLTAIGSGLDLISVQRSVSNGDCGFTWKDQNGVARWHLVMETTEKGDLILQGRRSDGAFQWNALIIDNNTGAANFLIDIKRNNKKIWGEDNDGAGSGLDADKLDGLEASAFAQLAQPTTFLSTFIANHTQHGFTTSTLITFSSASHWAKPQGWSGMINSSSVGMPTISHCYWTILGRRDTGGGYGGLLVEYAGGKVWYGYSDNDTKSPTWIELTNQSAGLSGTALNPIHLGVAENLNTVTASGIYACTSDLDAQAGSNYPEDLAGSLQVVNAPPSLTQTYITRTGNMHVRGTATGTWKKVTAT